MIEMVRKRPLISGFAALLLLFTLLSTFVIVPETKQAIVVPLWRAQPNLRGHASRH